MKTRSQVPETFALPGIPLIQILYDFSTDILRWKAERIGHLRVMVTTIIANSNRQQLFEKE